MWRRRMPRCAEGPLYVLPTREGGAIGLIPMDPARVVDRIDLSVLGTSHDEEESDKET